MMRPAVCLLSEASAHPFDFNGKEQTRNTFGRRVLVVSQVPKPGTRGTKGVWMGKMVGPRDIRL